jgi:DNA topoisomerase-1
MVVEVYIKFGKKMLKVTKKLDDTKYTTEELAVVPIEEVKRMIELQVPDAFAKKQKPQQKNQQPKKLLLKRQLRKKYKTKIPFNFEWDFLLKTMYVTFLALVSSAN